MNMMSDDVYVVAGDLGTVTSLLVFLVPKKWWYGFALEL
jgi:hypothetical protein